MEPSRKTVVLIALGDFASGVTSWALRLREAFAEHPRYVIRLLNCTQTGNAMGTFDFHATSKAQARRILEDCGEAIIVPNFVWDLFPLCAERIAAGQALRCVGFCRADSEDEYYAPLRWYAPLIGTVAAVSPTCAATLKAQGHGEASDIHTLPTGIHWPPQLTRSYQTAPLRIAYGGRIVQAQKRVMDFVPLVAKLYEAHVDFQFTIVGSGRARETLEAALAPVDPGGRVRLLDRKKPTQMAAFWAEQDVFVQTSAFEGTSNSMLESMAQGVVPVLTRTDSGVSGIIVHGENGFLVEVGDMAGMATALSRLARAPGLLSTMGARAHGAARPYSMEAYVVKFTALLDGARAHPVRSWPENRALTPPEPFHGIRLTDGEGGNAARYALALLFPSPLRGGAEDYTLRIAAGAVAAGLEVHGAFSGRHGLQELADAYVRVGAFHHRLEICDIGAKTGQAPPFKRFTRTVHLIRRLRPRVILFQLCGLQYGFISLFACACMGIPTLVVFQLVQGTRRFSPLRRALYRWMRRRGQHYVAVSQENRGRLAATFAMAADEIRVIPNGVSILQYSQAPPKRDAFRDTLRHTLNLPTQAILCLSVGRLARQKGHDVLVPAIPHIVAAHPQVHFVWAGEGPEAEGLIAQLETYGVRDRVHLLGHRDDIVALLHAADLLIHPARFEGQPFAVMEAMAAGLAVVSTSVGGICECIEDEKHGLLCPPDNVGALRDRILEALGDPVCCALRAKAAWARIEHFSEKRMLRETLAALNALAARP